MSSRYWGTLYLVPPDWDPDAADAEDGIVYSFEYGRSHIKVASELWSLCDPRRSAAIDEVMTRAYERKPAMLEQADIASLEQLLDGLEACLKGSFADDRMRVPADRIPELKRRTTMLEIDDVEGAVPEAAIAAGLSRVAAAREILRTARAEQLNVLVD